MKIKITGASVFVNRMFEACGNYQWTREFLKNSIEAGADRIEFGIEWQAVEKFGKYRRTISDNGKGMSRDELISFFSTLGEGSKTISGVHDNFGIGAKVSSLPWNSEGVVVVSYKNGIGSMVWIVLDPDSAEYELVEFETEDGTKSCCIEPTESDGVDWSLVKPDWVTDHGTVIVLLGSREHPDTVMGNGNADENKVGGLTRYLNTRFWDLSSYNVRVTEVFSNKKNLWPRSIHDVGQERRYQNRGIKGARPYLLNTLSSDGKPVAIGQCQLLSGRLNIEWYLWHGDLPEIHVSVKQPGYIALRYKDELFGAGPDEGRMAQVAGATGPGDREWPRCSS